MTYVFSNFFTHKDFLVPASQIPGTLYTPLHFIFESILLFLIIRAAVYVSNHKWLILPVFKFSWSSLVLWEIIICIWDSTAGKTKGLDLTAGLSLYPCSIFLYSMPFVIWGKGIYKQMACGYVCTLGMLGAVLNFLYPISRLTSYSCISFPGFHTFYFHGTMLFTFLIMMLSGYHKYTGITEWKELLYPSIPSLIISIPANILNYSPIHSDYMYFKGEFPFLAKIFSGIPTIGITLILYLLYISVPASFYLPSLLAHKWKETTVFAPIKNFLKS